MVFLEKPPNVEPSFRSFSSPRQPNSKAWADSYLAAFAIVSGSRFVTFDQAFQGKVKHLLVLRP